MSGGFRLRRARRADVPEILRLIKALARYEKMARQVVATEEVLRKSLFGRKPSAEVLLAQVGDRVVGTAIFFENFSSFLGRPGIYLEDLFVEPRYRGLGIGKALFLAVGKVAVQRGCLRYEWSVLDWNKPSIDFYRSFGARRMDDWHVFRLSGPALRRLGA